MWLLFKPAKDLKIFFNLYQILRCYYYTLNIDFAHNCRQILNKNFFRSALSYSSVLAALTIVINIALFYFLVLVKRERASNSRAHTRCKYKLAKCSSNFDFAKLAVCTEKWKTNCKNKNLSV